jgi:ArsR family metal-binding transcriptional regulator
MHKKVKSQGSSRGTAPPHGPRVDAHDRADVDAFERVPGRRELNSDSDKAACTTFFFESVRVFEQAKKLARGQEIGYCSFPFSFADPSIDVWALSVTAEDSARVRDILTAHNVQVVGQYDLPRPERPLPGSSLHSPDCKEENFIRKLWLTFVAQCFADESKIRLIAHHREDIASLLPYLNAVLKSAQYNPEVPVLCFKKEVRMISVYRDRIGIAKADDLLDAWLCLKEIKEKIQWVHEHKEEITPNFDMYTPPTALDVYKLLPRTNCRECGKPTCMAFAAAVANGEAEPDKCPILMKAEWAEGRNELLELLGEAP